MKKRLKVPAFTSVPRDVSEDTIVEIVRRRKPTHKQRINAAGDAWRRIRKAQGTPRAQFDNILDFSRELAQQSPKALLGVVRLLGENMMNATMTQVLRQDRDTEVVGHWSKFFFEEIEALTRDG